MADYLRNLMGAISRWEPSSANAIRAIVGERRARIMLDDEAATIRFEGERFIVRKAALPGNGNRALSNGGTDRKTCVALLAGHLEVSEAVMDGRLEINGSAEDVIDMCTVIELMIDASTRIPEIQQLARTFRAEAAVDLMAERHYRVERHKQLRALSEAEAVMLRRYHIRV